MNRVNLSSSVLVCVLVCHVRAYADDASGASDWTYNLNLSRLQFGFASLGGDSPHVKFGGDGSGVADFYHVGNRSGGFYNFYSHLDLAISADLHHLNHVDGDGDRHGLEDHSDMLVIPKGNLHTLLPFFSYGIVRDSYTLVVGASVFVEGSAPFLSWLDIRKGVHDHLFQHWKQSGGFGFVMTNNSEMVRTNCGALESDFTALARRARKLHEQEDSQESRGCDMAAQTLENMSSSARVSSGRTFDPYGWQVRFHVGSAFAKWHLTNPVDTEVTELQTSDSVKGDFSIEKMDLLLVIMDIQKQWGSVQPFVNVRLVVGEDFLDTTTKLGLRVMLVNGWTLLVNMLEYDELQVQASRFAVIPNTPRTIQSSIGLAWYAFDF